MEKGKNLFQDLTPEERVVALDGMATRKESQNVRRHYTADERDQMKNFVTEESIKLMDIKDEFSDIKKEFNKQIKEYGAQISGALKDLKRGYSDNQETVYLVDDQENGEMMIYDEKGNYISSRPLYPEERQTRLLEMKTGTND